MFWSIRKVNGKIVGGEATHNGTDYGNGGKPIIVKAFRRANEYHGHTTMAVKVPGGKHWAANHEPWASHGGEYIVLDVLEIRSESNEHLNVKAEPLVTFPLR